MMSFGQERLWERLWVCGIVKARPFSEKKGSEPASGVRIVEASERKAKTGRGWFESQSNNAESLIQAKARSWPRLGFLTPRTSYCGTVINLSGLQKFGANCWTIHQG